MADPRCDAALPRRVPLQVLGTLREGWRRARGIRGIVCAAMLLWSLVLLPVLFALQSVVSTGGEHGLDELVWQLFALLVLLALTYPFMAGVLTVALRHLRGQPVAIAQVFSQFARFGTYFRVALLQTLLMGAGFLLLVLPAVYFSVASVLAIPLVADRGMGAWEAIGTSCRRVTPHWFKVFAILLLAGTLTALGACLVLPLLWALPWLMLCLALLYRDLAGGPSP